MTTATAHSFGYTYDGMHTRTYINGILCWIDEERVINFNFRHQELKDCDVVFKERPRPKWKSRAGKGKKVMRV